MKFYLLPMTPTSASSPGAEQQSNVSLCFPVSGSQGTKAFHEPQQGQGGRHGAHHRPGLPAGTCSREFPSHPVRSNEDVLDLMLTVKILQW